MDGAPPPPSRPHPTPRAPLSDLPRGALQVRADNVPEDTETWSTAELGQLQQGLSIVRRDVESRMQQLGDQKRKFEQFISDVRSGATALAGAGRGRGRGGGKPAAVAAARQRKRKSKDEAGPDATPSGYGEEEQLSARAQTVSDRSVGSNRGRGRGGRGGRRRRKKREGAEGEGGEEGEEEDEEEAAARASKEDEPDAATFWATIDQQYCDPSEQGARLPGRSLPPARALHRRRAPPAAAHHRARRRLACRLSAFGCAPQM